jgi:hypothetical protein
MPYRPLKTSILLTEEYTWFFSERFKKLFRVRRLFLIKDLPPQIYAVKTLPATLGSVFVFCAPS